MNTKAIIGIFVGTIIIIGALLWLGRPGTSHDDQTAGKQILSSLKTEETQFDFGTISMANGKVNHGFKITNISDKLVTLKRIYTSCMCTAANFKFNGKNYGPFGMEGMGAMTATNITLNSGEAGTLEAVYDPAAHGPAGVGNIDRFVYLEDANKSKVELEIKAVVTP